MKRILSIFLVFILLTPCYGCTNQKIEEPVCFYYLRRSYDFGSPDSIFAAEIKDGSQYTSPSILLGAYLRGPSDLTLTSPFPAGTYLLDLDNTDGLLTITLSDNFAACSGIDLTLACCALAKTAIEFSGAESVQIQAITALLDGEPSITISSNNILLFDNYSENSNNSTQ